MTTGYQVGVQYSDEWGRDRHIISLPEVEGLDEETSRSTALAVFEAMRCTADAILTRGYTAMLLAESDLTPADIKKAFRDHEESNGRVIDTDKPKMNGVLRVVGVNCSVSKNPATLVC